MAFAEVFWRRIQQGLDLQRVTAGERRSWTVRLEHGIYLVRLDESPIGNRLFVDGREVARTSAWDYERPIPLDLGEDRGEVRFRADPRNGTLVTELIVGGRTIAPDRPARGKLPQLDWKLWIERAGYLVGAALVIGGLVGDPLAGAVSRAIWTAALLVWSSGVSGIDPLGLVPFIVEHGLAGQPSMIVAGLELSAATALARDRFALRRFVPPLGSDRWYVRALAWVVIVCACVGILALVG